jgi:hypothetical protein
VIFVADASGDPALRIRPAERAFARAATEAARMLRDARNDADAGPDVNTGT